jgi:hypothetical protein
MIKKIQCTVKENGWCSYHAYKTNVECTVGLFQQAKYNLFFIFYFCGLFQFGVISGS